MGLGRPKYRVDTAEWNGVVEKAEKDAAWKQWVQDHVEQIRGYPWPITGSSFGNRWVDLATGKRVTGYFDWSNNSVGEAGSEWYAPLTPAKRAKFMEERIVPLMARGYAGPWLDDINFQIFYREKAAGKHADLVSQEPEVAELRAFCEQIRARAGVGAVMEANSQFTDWWEYVRTSPAPIGTVGERAHVQAAMLQWNMLTIEHGVGVNSSVTSAPKWQQLLDMVDWLHSHGKQFVFTGAISVTEPEFLYHLATYFLLTDLATNVPAGWPSLGGDFINGSKQRPQLGGAPPPSNLSVAESTWWAGWDLDLGNPTSARVGEPGGLWKRSFTKGAVYVRAPGGTSTGPITLPADREWRNTKGEPVTEVTLPARSGAVFSTEAPPASSSLLPMLI